MFVCAFSTVGDTGVTPYIILTITILLMILFLLATMLMSPVQALAAFQWFSVVGSWESHFSWWERNLVIYVGALAMFLLSKRLKKRHNLKDDVRESLYDDCNMWTKALQKWVL